MNLQGPDLNATCNQLHLNIHLTATTKLCIFGVFLYLLAYVLKLVLGSKCVSIFQVRECRLDISGKMYATT